MSTQAAAFATYLAEGIRKFSAKGPTFPVYLEIETGGKSKDELLAEMKAQGFFVSNWAKDIMGKPAFKPGKRQTVKVARVKFRDLGFTKNPMPREICARIQELGHSLCEPHDGPAVRLALKDQARGDYFWLATKHILASCGLPHVFLIERNNNGPWLRAVWMRPNTEFYLDSEVVFRLRE